jgi:DNA-binding LacI/PurR family transcriptional regulator
MATIKDVAAMAEVSVSTVSYAINGTRPISKEKKAHIAAAMRKLSYRPHAIARGLASKRTRIIALLFPPVERGMGLSELGLILHAARRAAARGYHLVIWPLETGKAEELRQLLRQELVDGVILMEVHRRDPRIGVLKKLGLPFILLGRDRELPAENFIDVDFYGVMGQCLEYLGGLGHRRVLFINQSRRSFKNGYGPVICAHEAFGSLCKDRGIEGAELFCGSRPALVSAALERALERHPGISAVIAMNDKALPGIIRGIEHRGLTIPADVSVVSIVSGGEAASLFLPAVTAFEMDSPVLMSLTVDQLIDKLEGRPVETRGRLIPCVFRERQSTGRARDDRR